MRGPAPRIRSRAFHRHSYLHCPNRSVQMQGASSKRGCTMTALTIGMATYDDFDGVYLTIQGLQLFHDLADTEIVVIDNFGCETTRRFVANVHARYILFTESSGTCPPRDLLF